MKAGSLNRRVLIEQPVASTAFNGAGSGNWAPLAEVWPNVQDMLPSRGEKLAEGINVAARPSRIRIRFRDDVTPSMRFVMGGRIMQIVSGPAELGFREGLEFMVEEYRPAGNPA